MSQRHAKYTLTVRTNTQGKDTEKQFSIDALIKGSPSHLRMPDSTQSVRAKPSRRLYVANSVSIPCVCEDTGITSLIDIPRTGNEYFSYEHPLATLENARILAARSWDSLMQLDPQILAGILLTLANDYDLFRFAPTFSGAQKNSLLRTVSKPVLVDAVQLVEIKIHSGNYAYLPKLSFLMDGGFTPAGEFDRRVKEWLATTAQIIKTRHDYKNDLLDEILTEDQFYSTVPKKMMLPLTVRREAKRNETARIAQTKLFRANRKEAFTIIADLKKNSVLSAGRIDKLKEVFTGENLLFKPAEYIALIINVLNDVDNEGAKRLIGFLRTKYPMLKQKADDESDLWGDPSDEVGEATESSIVTSGDEQTVEAEQADPVDEVYEHTLYDEEGNAVEGEMLNDNGFEFIVDKAFYASLSPIEKILYKKKQAAVLREEAAERFTAPAESEEDEAGEQNAE